MSWNRGERERESEHVGAGMEMAVTVEPIDGQLTERSSTARQRSLIFLDIPSLSERKRILPCPWKRNTPSLRFTKNKNKNKNKNTDEHDLEDTKTRTQSRRKSQARSRANPSKIGARTAARQSPTIELNLSMTDSILNDRREAK